MFDLSRVNSNQSIVAPNPPPRLRRRSQSQDRSGGGVGSSGGGGGVGGGQQPMDAFCSFPNRLKRNFSFNKTNEIFIENQNPILYKSRNRSNLEINRTLSHQPLGHPFDPLFGPQIHPLMRQMWTTMGDNNTQTERVLIQDIRSLSPLPQIIPNPISSSQRLSPDYRPKEELIIRRRSEEMKCADAKSQSGGHVSSSFNDHFNQYSSSRTVNRLSDAFNDVTDDDVTRVLNNNKSTNDLKSYGKEELEAEEVVMSTKKPIRRTSLGGRKASLPADYSDHKPGKEWSREQVSSLSHVARVGLMPNSGSARVKHSLRGYIGLGFGSSSSATLVIAFLVLINFMFLFFFYRLVALVPNR